MHDPFTRSHPSRPPRAGRIWIGQRCRLAASLALALSTACTSASSKEPPTTADALPEACDAYLTSYRGCMSRLGRDPQAVDARIAATRDALLAAHDAGAIATRCVASMKQLQTSCF